MTTDRLRARLMRILGFALVFVVCTPEVGQDIQPLPVGGCS